MDKVENDSYTAYFEGSGVVYDQLQVVNILPYLKNSYINGVIKFINENGVRDQEGAAYFNAVGEVLSPICGYNEITDEFREWVFEYYIFTEYKRMKIDNAIMVNS